MTIKHMYFICPYRARGNQQFRKDQLRIFLTEMKMYLPKFGQKYTILIIEQNNDLPFNRGLLCNIGYLEAKKKINPAEQNMFSHHNIDIIPKTVDYFSFNNIGLKDIFGHVVGTGAVYMFHGPDFEKANGYPNLLWGWGADDSALFHRLEKAKIPIDRSEYNTGSVYELNDSNIKDHSSNQINILIEQIEIQQGYWVEDGLNSVEYQIDSIEYNEEMQYWHYKVNFPFKHLSF